MPITFQIFKKMCKLTERILALDKQNLKIRRFSKSTNGENDSNVDDWIQHHTLNEKVAHFCRGAVIDRVCSL